MRLSPLCIALVCAICGAASVYAWNRRDPEGLSARRLSLYEKAVKPVLEMSEKEMLDLVPTQSGLYFVGCAHCEAGQQEGQLTVWDPAKPHSVTCAFCGHVYPSPDYPMDQVEEVVSPDGTVHRYPYYASRPSWWEGDEPYRTYFAARVDYHRIRYMETAANRLAQVYADTGDLEHARRAALILQRFAEVYPGYCYHYDFPFHQKVIHAGEVAPQDFRGGFRTSRWTWWGYSNISRDLLEAYELVGPSGEIGKLAAETGKAVDDGIRAMFAMMADQVLGSRDDLTNMSPGMWASLVHAGRVLGEPGHVHTAIGRLRRMVSEQFFCDGAWQEGAPSYHSQVMGGLRRVVEAARGYSDPPGYANPETGERFDELELDQDIPEVARAARALRDMRLPNGRNAPVHDTWWTDTGDALQESKSVLLPGLGHGILGRGTGDDQMQVHLTWSPGYGHKHYDGLSLLLFARGRELLSDIGYTHTRWREWPVCTASHNLVVVDGLNQEADPETHGHLRYFDARNAECQVLSVDNPQVYPGAVSTYRRTLALVGLGEEAAYAVDLFRVDGGEQHDYLLHGSADEAQELTASKAGEAVATAPLSTLVPEGVDFRPGENEQTNRCGLPGFAYGYLSHLRGARMDEDEVVQIDYGLHGSASGAEGGLRAWCVMRAGDELVLGTNPAIRQARNDDSKLGEYDRSFALLRRRGGASLFATVAEPHGGAPLIERVDVADLPGAELALEVVTAAGKHLIVAGARDARGQWLGEALRVDGELAILRGAGEASVVGGALRWGDTVTEARGPVAHRLLAADRGRDGHSLLVEGELQPPPGTIAMVDQAGERVSAVEVVSAAMEGANSRLVLRQDPGFEYDASCETSTFAFLPLTQHRGRHVVRVCPVGHAGAGE